MTARKSQLQRTPPEPPSSLPMPVPHDPRRIRKEALRRSLFFAMFSWVPGAFWQGAVSGAPSIKLAIHLGANDFIFALLWAAPFIGVLWQIPGSIMLEHLGKRKTLFIVTAASARFLYVCIGLLPWLCHARAPYPALGMVLLVTASASFGNFGDASWTNWMANLIPPRIRGKFFGRRTRMGLGIMCVVGLGVAVLMDLSERPWFNRTLASATRWAPMPPLIFLISLLFIIGGCAGIGGILFYIKADEPPMGPLAPQPLHWRLWKPLHDHEFRRFVIYRSVWAAAQGFCGWTWWLYLLDFFDHQKELVQHAWWREHMFLVATVLVVVGSQVGQFMGYAVWGRAVDRFGCKPVALVSSTLHSIAWAWWIFLSPALLPWLMLTEVLGGFFFGGQDIAAFNMMLRFNRRSGPAYQALGSVIFSTSGALSTLAAGWLAEHWLKHFAFTFAPGTPYEHTFNRYALLIAVAVAIKYTADLAFLPAVHEVGDKRASHALRFVLHTTYGNLNTLIFAPLRTGAGLTNRGITGVKDWWRE